MFEVCTTDVDPYFRSSLLTVDRWSKFYRVTSSLLWKWTRLPTHACEVRALTFEVTDNFGSNGVRVTLWCIRALVRFWQLLAIPPQLLYLSLCWSAPTVQHLMPYGYRVRTHRARVDKTRSRGLAGVPCVSPLLTQKHWNIFVAVYSQLWARSCRRTQWT